MKNLKPSIKAEKAALDEPYSLAHNVLVVGEENILESQLWAFEQLKYAHTMLPVSTIVQTCHRYEVLLTEIVRQHNEAQAHCKKLWGRPLGPSLFTQPIHPKDINSGNKRAS